MVNKTIVSSLHFCMPGTVLADLCLIQFTFSSDLVSCLKSKNEQTNKTTKHLTSNSFSIPVSQLPIMFNPATSSLSYLSGLLRLSSYPSLLKVIIATISYVPAISQNLQQELYAVLFDINKSGTFFSLFVTVAYDISDYSLLGKVFSLVFRGTTHFTYITSLLSFLL